MSKPKSNNLNNQSGFIAFTSILVISAVVLAIATSISLIGVGAAKNSLDFKKGQEALKLAEGCAEESLLRLRDDVNYVGGGLNVDSGSCTISVSGSGSDRVIDVEATITGPPFFVKKLRLTVMRTGNSINLTDWQEVR